MTPNQELLDLIVTLETHCYEYGRLIQYGREAQPVESVIIVQQARGYLRLIEKIRSAILTYLGDENNV